MSLEKIIGLAIVIAAFAGLVIIQVWLGRRRDRRAAAKTQSPTARGGER